MINGADTVWLMVSSALVLMMTLPALGFFYAGLVQAKNILSVLFQTFAIAAMVSLFWFVFVYSECFSGSGAWIGDLKAAFLNHMARGSIHPGTAIPESVFVMYQMTFAAITPALIIGAYVERIKFGAVLLFSALWLVLVYAPACHWIWGGGFLAQWGAMDFAGGIVVHLTAGLSALLAAWALGPRRGFPHSVNPPHAPWMVMVGAAFLWVGWFGFNAGSALKAGADAGMTMLATHLAAATATCVWMGIEWIKFGKPSLVGAVTGTVAGLATITPASGYVGPEGAVVLGILGGLVTYGAVLVVKRHMKVDDALDVLGVHGVGGALGSLVLPFVTGLGNGGTALARSVGAQFLVQLEAVAIVGAWSLIATALIILAVKKVAGWHIGREGEIQGLDFTSHGEAGYHSAG
ncbi:Amt family ammonium transporter [Rhizomicrobium palustre]|uniref:Ammonium transporter n=1 Tax=Rhizomicrobium palustre TaxID=189966 RepID=A0A846N3J1_9PROT|nr:ammonium transporter [Rhizomicrobium palustre]NIK89677.1 Amt family ammonium transporter [Rhizomicrobium palustre]